MSEYLTERRAEALHPAGVVVFHQATERGWVDCDAYWIAMCALRNRRCSKCNAIFGVTNWPSCQGPGPHYVTGLHDWPPLPSPIPTRAAMLEAQQRMLDRIAADLDLPPGLTVVLDDTPLTDKET